MAKKIGIIVLLCFSLCVGGVSAFADEGHAEADTQALIETQPPVSSVLFRQSGADIQQSVDEGKTWQSYFQSGQSVHCGLAGGFSAFTSPLRSCRAAE